MMVWIFIFMELLAFGLAFIVFAALRAKSLSVFESSQAELNQTLAVLNTLVLLTSGYLVVLANGSYDRGNDRHASRWLGGAISLGCVFVIVKAVEYRDKIAHGLTTGVNQFFDFMEMKHAHRIWQVSMTLFMLMLFGAISFSL